MDQTQSQENRMAVLEKKVNALYAAQTIPYDVDRSFQARGFSKVGIVAGIGQISVGGDYSLVIPGANANSIVVTSEHYGAATAGSVTSAIVQFPDTTYGVYAEGVFLQEFNFIVVLNAPIASTI